MDKQLKQHHSSLRELQLKELEILRLISGMCQDSGIKFSLYAGTALGAVRNHGFIPWDDDLDICMMRDDYIKFKKICETKLDTKYFFQDYHTDREFIQCFGKIRDSGTTFIESGTANLKMNKGVFVDIFPLDYVPRNAFKKIAQRFYAAFNLLFARGFASKKNGMVINLITKIILNAVPKGKQQVIKFCCERKMQNRTGRSDGLVNLTATFSQLKLVYPANLLKETVDIDFEGTKMPVFKQYDEYLKAMYGNYLKLPPQEKRHAKHDGFIIDTKTPFIKYI